MTTQEAKVLNIGQRVMAAVHTDRWMMGDRYGTVERVTRTGIVHVYMDRSCKSVRFSPCNLDFH